MRQHGRVAGFAGRGGQIGITALATVVVGVGWAIPILDRSDYPGVLFVPLAVGSAFAGGGVALASTGRTRLAGAFLIAAAVAIPTFFIYVVNVALLIVAAVMLIRGSKATKATA